MNYVLTFTLAPGNEECSGNSTAVNISAPGRSKVFFLERRYGRRMWESHAYYLGSWGNEKNPINLEIQSVSMDADHNMTCWPVVDTFLITRITTPKFYDGNILTNGGFEVGPVFIRNSSEGILLDADRSDEENHDSSALQQWNIIGTVKYIDSKHYSIPAGNRAIELVSGAPSGIITTLFPEPGSTYTLEFMMGDAGDSCIGDFIVYAQLEMDVRNFTMRSNGTGSARKQSTTFKIDQSSSSLSLITTRSISLVSFNETQTGDGVFCGPVIDNVVLRSNRSNGFKLRLQNGVLFSSLFWLIVLMGM